MAAVTVILTRTVGRVGRVWQSYITFVEQYPAKASIANTGFLMASGDAIAQLILERRKLKDYDVTRTVRFAFVGAALAGPCMFVWYRALDRHVRFRSKGARTVVKTLADQILFLPPYLGGFVAVMAALRGEDAKTIHEKLSRDFKPMLMTSYGVWPITQLFNFYVLPFKHRILLINLVCLFWNSYIGWKAERKS